MRYSHIRFLKITIAAVAIFLLSTNLSWGKKTKVTFHEVKDNLIVALDENDQGVFNEFYVVKLLAPLNKNLFKNDKYKVSVKKGVLVLVGKRHTLILTVDKAVIQTAFKQRGTYYILVNGIAHGKASGGTTVDEIIRSGLIDKVFKEKQASDGNITLTLVAKHEKFEENEQLSFF